MKLTAALRRACLAAVLAFSALQVQAAANVFEQNASFQGNFFQFQYFDPFSINVAGSYRATIVDSNSVLAPFSFLGMAVFLSGGSPVANPITTAAGSSGSFDFNVAAPHNYTVLAFGTPGASATNLSSFGITIAPIPEPEIWALMLVGTGLIGFQLQRKRKAAEANRLPVA